MISWLSELRKSELSLSRFLQMSWSPFLFRLLPFAVSQKCVRALGRFYYLVNRPERILVADTIRRAFTGNSAGQRPQLTLRAVFQGIFDHYHEKLFVGYANFPHMLDFLKKRVDFQGLESLHAALATGRGVILVTGHFGALEFLPGALTMRGFPTSMICRFRSTRLREAQGRRSRRIGLDLIEPDRGKGLWAALRALKSGRILITECDEFENWRPDSRLMTDFLGRRLSPDRTLELLQRRAQARVLTALVQRTGPRRYSCHLTPVDTDPAGSSATLDERCLEVLETAVRTSPEQWYQWREFGKLFQTQCEPGYDHQEGGYLAPEPAVSLADHP